MSIDTTIELDRVTYDPPLTESDFNTDIVAPVDYRVTVDGASHLPYKWDGMAAVPGIPVQPVREFETIAPSGGDRRMILIAINVALILALVLVLWRKHATA